MRHAGARLLRGGGEEALVGGAPPADPTAAPLPQAGFAPAAEGRPAWEPVDVPAQADQEGVRRLLSTGSSSG